MKKKILGMSYVKATELNRGKASSYIKEVHEKNDDLLIMKHNDPYAVIISMEKYEKMKEAYERKMQ